MVVMESTRSTRQPNQSNGNGLVVSDCLIMYNSNGIRYGRNVRSFSRKHL